MKRLLSVILLLMLFSPILLAEEPETTAPQKKRPKVGLVFSGGGAKGMAHIGALKIIEESGIPIDYVVGTSIGSIIGGIYALGYSADDMDSLVRAQDWNLLIRDQVDRRSVSYLDKEDRDRYLFTLPFMNRAGLTEQTEAGKGRNRSVLRNMPGAVVEGQYLDQLFTKLSVGYQDDVDFNSLPIPFSCVAVDLNTKEEVVWHKGSIVTAIRSSMSIPAFFVPVKVGNRYLVDGGMVNNMPVDVVREMGADYVICVDLHHFKKPRVDTDQTLPEMIGTMLSMMNGEKYQSARRNSDIIIEPNTSDFGILAFDDRSVEALIDSGRVAGERVLPQLQSLAQHLKEFPDEEQQRPPKAVDLGQDSVMISQVEISGADPNEMKWFLSKTKLAPGEIVSGEDMDKAMAYLYNTRAYNKVYYRIAGTEEEGYRLKIFISPQRTHQVGIGFRFDSEEMASVLLGISLNKRKLFGSKLDLEMELGSNINGTLRYSYTFHNLTRLNVSAHLHRMNMDVYQDISLYDEENTKYDYSLDHTDRYNFFRSEANYQLTGWRNADFQIGVRYDNMDYRIMSAVSFIDDHYKAQSVNPFINMQFDNLDDNYFPTRGLKMRLEAGYNRGWSTIQFDSGETLDYANRFAEGIFNLKAAIPLGRKAVLIPQTWNRVLFGDPLSFYQNYVGGEMPGRYTSAQMPFIGINHVYLNYDKVDIVRADLRINLFKQHYLTLYANYMLGWDYIPENFVFQHNYGFGAGYSLNTIIGPIKVIAHWSNLSRRVGFYFALGFDF